SEASHSARMDSGLRTRLGSSRGFLSSQIKPHFVKMKGRSEGGSERRKRPTTRSEWPSPYTAAVSIQLTPSSMAWRIVFCDTWSSCGPHPNDHPPPPIAHAPNPTVVISSPLEPSARLSICMIPPMDCRHLAGYRELSTGSCPPTSMVYPIFYT